MMKEDKQRTKSDLIEKSENVLNEMYQLGEAEYRL